MGSGTVGVTLWGGNLSFVGGNIQESVGGTSGVPQKGDKKDGQASEGQELEKRGSVECTQRSRNTDTGGVH